jgi:LysR family glycine cleavage system transcriptional activator
LNALRAFESAARHRSMRRAAAELHVTPAAVSQQVRALEDHLGLQLFVRANRGLVPTPRAEAAIARLREGFDALADAVERMRGETGAALVRVAAAPSFASKWLAPRVHAFLERYPDTDLRIAAEPHLIDAAAGATSPEGAASATDFDLAIRFGTGGYAGDVERLFTVSATPLCSPQLISGDAPLRVPADLRHHPLMHDDTIPPDQGGATWSAWLALAGVADIDTARGVHFNHAVLGLEAAIDGAGVILGYPVLAASDLAHGRLVAPFDLALPLEHGYYLQANRDAQDNPRVGAFRDWLLEQAANGA